MEDPMSSTTPPRSSITAHTCEKDDIKYCFTVTIFDQTIYTFVSTHPDFVTDWIVTAVASNISLCHIGFEVEYDLTTNRIATLQFYFRNQCLIVQLIPEQPLPPVLDLFLGDHKNIFIGTDIRSKILKLRAQSHFKALVHKENAIDMCEVFPFLLDAKQGELDLMPLGKVETDWDRLPYNLSLKQVHYACLDVFLNLHIWLPLSTCRFHHRISEKTSITPYPKVDGAIENCYDVVVFGETIFTTVTKNVDAVKEWVDAVSTQYLGFEVEYDQEIRLGTLQFCDGPRCLIFQPPEKSHLPPFLCQFFADKNRTFVGKCQIIHHINLLKKQFGFSGEVKCVVGENSLENIVWKRGRLGSIELEKKETELTSLSELSDKQVHYACVDVFINYQVARNLSKIPSDDKS